LLDYLIKISIDNCAIVFVERAFVEFDGVRLLFDQKTHHWGGGYNSL